MHIEVRALEEVCRFRGHICTGLMYNRCVPFSRYIIDLPKIKNVVWDSSGEQDRRVILLKVTDKGASASQHTNHCRPIPLQVSCSDVRSALVLARAMR